MAQTIVTGAEGLLGRHLVPLLRRDGYGVVSLTRPDFDLAGPLNLGPMSEPTKAIIYLAQSRRFREFPGGALDMFEVNVARVAELLDYAHRYKIPNFVLASTGGVYNPSDGLLTEGSALADPMGYYPASKLSAEMLARCYQSEMNVTILRYFTIYGPGQHRDMLVPRLIDNVRSGRPITLQGPDGLRLMPIHAADAAQATRLAAYSERSATINVAGPEVLSIREIGEAIGTSVGRKPVFDLQARSQPVDYVPDVTLMHEYLGPPAIGFRRAIDEWVGNAAE